MYWNNMPFDGPPVSNFFIELNNLVQLNSLTFTVQNVVNYLGIWNTADDYWIVVLAEFYTNCGA